MYDLVIVGGGIAGLTAARRAQQLGAKVLLLEKSNTCPGDSNSRQSGAGYAAAGMPHTTPPDVLYARIMDLTDGHARPDVARVWADNIARAFDFHVEQGAKYGSEGGHG